MSEQKNNLGNKIKQLRKERGWTQEQLARHSGVNRSTIAYIETGRISKPPADTFLKLARAFNIKPDELYLEAGYIHEDKIGYQPKETSEQILEKLRISMPTNIPIYEEYHLHAGEPVEPMDYVAMVKRRAGTMKLEGYIVHGTCLHPDIQEGDIIIIDREGNIDIGNIVACLYNDMLHLGKLKKIGDEYFLENNNGRLKIDEVRLAAPVIEVRRRLR